MKCGTCLEIYGVSIEIKYFYFIFAKFVPTCHLNIEFLYAK